MNTSNIAEKFKKTLESKNKFNKYGKITNVKGLIIESSGPHCKLGEICKINIGKNKSLFAEVVGFNDNKITMMPIGDTTGLGLGMKVESTGDVLKVNLTENLKGRVLNGIGEPSDGKGIIIPEEKRSIFSSSPDPLKRKRIKEILPLGISAIDGVMTFGKGQRMGVFSGSGVGKSTLMGMIARYTSADINVIALIGERGREVREFIEKELGEDGLKKSIVIVATSDQPPLLRLRGAFVAHTIAEYFRDKGNDVMLMMDSVTRFARAQREVGLSIGESPANRGFTPSVFALLPKLLERSGTSEHGTITGLYTILVDADDMNEPIADNVRGILDGHIVLSRNLAHKNHYPAIDVLESISRVMIDIADKEHIQSAGKLKEVVSTYKESEDLINIGSYKKGSNKNIDYAINMIDKINNFLKQGIFEKRDFNDTVNALKNMFKK